MTWPDDDNGRRRRWLAADDIHSCSCCCFFCCQCQPATTRSAWTGWFQTMDPTTNRKQPGRAIGRDTGFATDSSQTGNNPSPPITTLTKVTTMGRRGRNVWVGVFCVWIRERVHTIMHGYRIFDPSLSPQLCVWIHNNPFSGSETPWTSPPTNQPAPFI